MAPPIRFALLRDGRWLRHQYETTQRSLADIAAEVGCSTPHAGRMLDKHEIPRRSPGSGRRPAVVHIGERYGRLRVLGELPGRVGNAGGGRQFACFCDCGEQVVVPSGRLRSGQTQSCGCLRRDSSAARKPGLKHGLSSSGTYRSYAGAKYRCAHPGNPKHRHYAGRGIEFRYPSFEDFLADLGERPTGTTLDRIDVDGHYEPGNCRWATPSEQNANRRPQFHLSDEQIAVLRAAGLGVGSNL